MVRTLIVFVGGGIGSVLRYLVSGWVYSILGAGFPYGTFAVNVAGSFVIGLFLAVSSDRFLVAPELRAFVAIGILGGFTTFSTFTYETLELFKDGAYFTGGMNVLVSVATALTAAWLGNLLGKII